MQLITVAFMALDVTHWRLDRAGSLNLFFDIVLHVLIAISAFWYIGNAVRFGANGWEWLARKINVSRWSLTLLLILVLVLIYRAVVGPEDYGSSSYHPLYPGYVAGLFPAMLTYGVATHLSTRMRARILVILVSLLWLTGPLIVDCLAILEGGERGSSRLIQNIPVIGGVYLVFLFAHFFGMFVAVLVVVPAIGWAVNGCIAGRMSPLPALTFSASSAILGYLMLDWSSFIMD